MKNIKTLLVLIGFLTLYSCTTENEILPNNEIVLIIKDRPEPWKHYRKLARGGFTPMKAAFFYRDKYGIRQEIIPNEGIDTIVVPTDKAVTEFFHRYNGWDMLYYYFEKGDIVVVEYKDKTPVVNVINRLEEYDTNLDLAIKKIIYKDELPSYKKAQAPELNMDLDFTKPYDEIRAEADVQGAIFKKEGLLQLQQEKQFIDSLYKIQELPDWLYQLKNNGITLNEKTAHRMGKLEELFQMKIDSSFAHFGVYFQYLIAKRDKLFEDDMVIIRVTNGSYRDSRLLYDAIWESEDFDKWEKEMLMRQELEAIINNFGSDDIKTYQAKHIALLADSVYVNHLKEKYALDYSNSGNMLLLTANNDTITWSEVLAKERGKIVFVDYWASWCAPCRRAMPKGKSIAKQFEDKPITFVYLAVHDELSKWKKAIKEEDLLKNPNSYFILNSKTSNLIEQLDVSTIPRYLIYDTNGTLTNRKAPGPSDNLITVLEKMVLQ